MEAYRDLLRQERGEMGEDRMGRMGARRSPT
jgi:hypothetical protein